MKRVKTELKVDLNELNIRMKQMVVIERDIEQINSIEIEEVTSTEGEATISYTDNETKAQ